MRKLHGVRELLCDYDGFLVDLWGVVHDGERPFDGVLAALAELARSGARVCFLSNSSRLGASLAAALVAMGLPREHFVDVVSSGDVTRAALLDRDPAVFAGLSAPTRVLHVGSSAYVPWLLDMPFELITERADAELIVSTGTVPDAAAMLELQQRLAPLCARDVPLVCTNPDRLVRSAHGLHLAPGAVAHAYADAGGRAFFYGKPHAPIYRAALQRLGVARDRVICIGDMLDTDIRGARAAGLASVLVLASGVHAAELQNSDDDDDEAAAALQALFQREGTTPDAIIERFV